MEFSSRKPSLFSGIAIGVGCMVGSGSLFAAYYASKYAGPISILSWILGAVLSLCIAMLLAEIATMYKDRGLFSRLLGISHKNKDYGFVIAIANWTGLLIAIPSEAMATMQYVSTINASWQQYIFVNGQMTGMGLAGVTALILVYGLINYWGVKSLTKVNNIIIVFKLAVPVITGILLIMVAFHPSNFTSYAHSIEPYGIGSAFSAVVNSGIFYAYYGFSMVAVFGAELKNPKKNIPRALIGAVVIALVIYLLLQVAFIGALPENLVARGWHHLNFASPLAELLLMVNLNVWCVILYVNSAVTPSGTGIIYTGSASRMLTGMARDHQMPGFFDQVHPVFNLSRRSLVLDLLLCIAIVLFFKSWKSVVVLVTVFQLITCLAVPVAFTKLRLDAPDKKRSFVFRGGLIVSPVVFVFVSYLLIQASIQTLATSLVTHIIFFIIYSFSYYRGNITAIYLAFKSSWTVFAYLVFVLVFGAVVKEHGFEHVLPAIFFVLGTGVLFTLMVRQKNYHDIGVEEKPCIPAGITKTVCQGALK